MLIATPSIMESYMIPIGFCMLLHTWLSKTRRKRS